MMRSAMAFLPDSMMTLMNLDRSTEPNFGSGRMSRLGTSRRRGISLFLLLQLARVFAFASGATDFWGHPLTRQAKLLVDSCQPSGRQSYRRSVTPSSDASRRTWNATACDLSRLASRASHARCDSAHPADP